MEYLKAALAALLSILKEPLTKLAAFLMGRRQGQLEKELEQNEAARKDRQRATNARNKYRRGELRDVADKYHTNE